MKKSFYRLSGAVLALVTALQPLGAVAAPSLNYTVESSAASNAAEAANMSSIFTLEFTETTDMLAPGASEDVIAELSDEANGNASLFATSTLFDGEGTEESPYILSSAKHLRNLTLRVNVGDIQYTSAHYRLEADIDFNGSEWTPIGLISTDSDPKIAYAKCFSGVFDGNGHTISDFTITKDSRSNIGFFGAIYNGTVKNLTIKDADIKVNINSRTYAGVLSGCAVSLGLNQTALIENCHVANSTLTITNSANSLYTGGLVGYLHASDGATVKVTDSSADVSSNVAISSQSPSATESVILRTGGLIGYIGAVEAKAEILRNYVAGSIYASSAVKRAAYSDSLVAAGLVGFIGAMNSGTSLLSDCYSTASVHATSGEDCYASGLVGYAVTNVSPTADAFIEMKNIYSSSNIYGKSTATTDKNGSYLAGAFSVAGSEPKSSLSIHDVYAFGNVYDNDSLVSESGKFVAYTEGDVTIAESYVRNDSELYTKTIIAPETVTVLTEEQAIDFTSYIGFDSTAWKKSDSSYAYPVLTAVAHVDPVISVRFMNGTKLVEEQKNLGYKAFAALPTKMPTSNYVFSHWSTYPGGEAVDILTYSLTSDTDFYANFTDEYVSYSVNFSANGNVFQTDTLKYNSPISFPTAPEKPEDSFFRYFFSHWSLKEGGEAVDLSVQKVTGDTTYYAVYAKVESDVWDGATALPFEIGDGTENAPYEIKNGYQLYYLAKNITTNPTLASAYYTVTRDINLGGKEWLPIGTKDTPFTGHFVGAGYSIYGFTVTNGEYLGLFGVIDGANIEKLDVSGFTLSTSSGKAYAGGIAGAAFANAKDAVVTISECSTHGTISLSGTEVYGGGIVGHMDSKNISHSYIEDSYSNATISTVATSSAFAGGIAGKFSAVSLGDSGINRSYYNGEITVESLITGFGGGIVGHLVDDDPAYIASASLKEVAVSGTVRNSFAAGSVIFSSTDKKATGYTGQIYGSMNSSASVNNCFADKKMTIKGTKEASTKNITLTSFKNLGTENVLSEMGFDLESCWVLNEGGLPTLKTSDNIKNIYRVLEATFDKEDGILDVSFSICFRDVTAYNVLAAAYDARGKMLGYKTVHVDDPSTLQTVDVTLRNINGATGYTVSVVDAVTMALLETPLVLQY